MNGIEQLLHTLPRISTPLNQNLVQKLKESPHFSGEGEYDHMEFIRNIGMIKEDFELPDRLVTAIFTPYLPNQLIDGISTQDKHMDNKF
ncbi:hypothetical protein O181_057131 [Austropuccinia psidii MF-1]|uniref:Uncharacterized protein n=1 Tax=Austropuccinia psidii MF-1 TaxID=1389203 RepID=A0A9Q3EEK0_9BASI|nr:hypothetical protein [Austropuccinia psidii MF-1]